MLGMTADYVAGIRSNFLDDERKPSSTSPFKTNIALTS